MSYTESLFSLKIFSKGKNANSGGALLHLESEEPISEFEATDDSYKKVGPTKCTRTKLMLGVLIFASMTASCMLLLFLGHHQPDSIQNSPKLSDFPSPIILASSNSTSVGDLAKQKLVDEPIKKTMTILTKLYNDSMVR